MIQPRSSFVTLDALRLHYLEWDPAQLSDAPEQPGHQENDDLPLVLLHGLGASADTWRLVAEELYRQRQVIAFDLRGHGQSDQPDDGYDLVSVAEDVIGGMAALGLGQVALVGHGWGARVALVMAVRHPALISHLILVDCPHIEPRHWPGMTRERFIREQAPKEIYASRTSFLEAMRREMAAFWSPEVESIVLTYVRELPDGRIEERLLPQHQRLIRESLWEDRALSYYGKVACPVLLVPAAAQPQPGDEPPERLENAEEFAAAKGYMAAQVARTIQRCIVLWMPETAHDIQLQRSQVLANAITSFVRI
jgi:pimeloyl-ACP methyl ester carboxylesterase